MTEVGTKGGMVKHHVRNFLVVGGFLLASITGCRSVDKGTKGDAPTGLSAESSSDLTWQEAQGRKARLDNVSYDVAVDLNETDSTFTGRTEIQFDLKDAGKPLRVDFFAGKVSNITANGKNIPLGGAKKPYWIELPAGSLHEGRNRVSVEYVQEYSHQGQGLHRFVDPQTKQVFLYTQFETFDANRFMPCFDQPDLRAIFTLRVDAPASWEVISTTRESSVKITGPQRKLWSFPKTLPISTYLFSLHAGPYQVWKDQYAGIPLRLFARPSLAKYVNPRDWFTFTKQGLKFFESYFQFKYPFKKYDQLIVPEFNAGAMENPGAVTFSERYLPRSQPTRQQRRHIAWTLLHEMAHMWFGDTVTMKWWNDLWLNESFASFMSTVAAYEATEFKEVWQQFFAGDKIWAYWEDGLVTTHPIEAPVNSVKQAFANFDGITYGKGAAVLNQLRAYMGAKQFQKGIQNYIAANAIKNAELKDFIAALQAQTTVDLNLWAGRWLRQSGTDKIAAQWTCAGDKLTEIKVLTTSSPGAQFRPQKVTVGLYVDRKGQLAKPIAVVAELKGPMETVKGTWTCPSFVHPNILDEGYAAVTLDPRSLEYAQKHLSEFKDDLLRTMVWDNLWQMVRATEMPLKDYVTIIDSHFPKEKNSELLDLITGRIASSAYNDKDSVLWYWPQSESARKERLDFIYKMERHYLRRFESAKAGSDEQKLWFDRYVGLARTPQALDHLAAWARQDKVAPGFTLDMDRRWLVVKQLMRFKHSEAEKLLAHAKTLDKSDMGVRSAMAAEAIQPDPTVKEKWVNILKQPKPQVSFTEARLVSYALFPIEQKTLARKFEPVFYEYLKKNATSEDEIMVRTVAQSLSPLSCDAGVSAPFKIFLNERSSFVPSLAKALKVNLQEDERCQKIRAAANL